MTPVNDKFLVRVLRLLEEDLPEFTFELRREDQVVYSGGAIVPNAGHTRAFLGGELFISKRPEQITQREKIAIKSAERLGKLLLPRLKTSDAAGPGAVGTVSLNVLLGAFHEILKLLESKSVLLDNYERIIRLNQEVLQARDLQGTLQVIMDMSREFLGGGGSSLLLVDSRTGEMYFNVISGDNAGDLGEIRIPSGAGIAGSVVQNARAEIIPDVGQDPRSFRGVDEELGRVTRDMIVAPIIARGVVIGVIEVVNSSSEYGFLHDDLEFLVNIASHTSLLIENAKSKEDLVRANRELDRKVGQINALHEIGTVLSASLDPEVLRKNLLRNLMRLLKLRHGAVYLPDHESHSFETFHRLEYSERGFQEIEDTDTLADAGDILLWMKENQEPLAFDRARREHGVFRRFYDENQAALERYPSELWVPVLGPEAQRVLFVISLGASQLEEHGWLEDRAFFQGVMTAARSAFRNVESFQNVLHAREKENQIRRVFQKYVPPRVVHEVLTREENPEPRSQPVTVLFADIWGFTRLAENTNPALLLELLNEFFEEMVTALNARGGIVDKFMGDSLMSLFGVPDPDPSGAGGALRAAVEMHERLARLNQRRRLSGRPEFRMAIGLSHGQAITGNVGSTQRTDYTAVGDTVNLASRLERLNRQYNTSTLLTEAAVGDAEQAGVVVREIDLIRVRGRTATTRLFELAWREDTAADWTGNDAEWQGALARYRSGAFPEAMDRFRALEEAMPGDPVVALYLERLERLGRSAPENEWDGVFKVDV